MIRLATADDLPRLPEVERAADQRFRALGMDGIAEGQVVSGASLDTYRRAGRAWVRVDGFGRPEGFLLLDVVDGDAHIEQVSVLPRCARRGIGAALIHTALGWARRRGLGSATLMTFRDVPWNRAYYERLGFVVVPEGQLTDGLRRLRARESELGVDRWPRVAMRRPV